MSRMTNISTVLASLLTLTAALPTACGSAAYAAETVRLANNESDRGQEQRLPALSGELVRIVAINAPSCERKPAAAIDVKAVSFAAKAQKVRLARLEAELLGRDEIVLPEELQDEQTVEPVASALRDEQLIFEARKEALASKLAALEEEKVLKASEIELTTAKQAAFERQEALAQQELDRINGLLKKGLAIAGQNLALEQNVLQLQAGAIDIKLSILAAEQRVNQVDRSISDLRNQWRNDSRAELNKTQSNLAKLAQQALSASSEADADLQVSTPGCDSVKQALYVIVRGPSGSIQAIPVSQIGRSAAASEAMLEAR